VSLRVQVLESRPVILDGAVRHRMVLEILEPSVEGCKQEGGPERAKARR
jgi:hypothetical protein